MWTSQDKGTLQERCDATTVLLPLRSCTWFQTMLSNIWDDIVLTGLLIEKTFTQVQNIHRSFVAWTGIEQCMPTTCVVPGASASVPRRPPEAHSGQTGFREKAPEATRRSTGRRKMATSRLQSSCCQKVPPWTPRRTMARGLNPGSRARYRVSLTWGDSTKCWEQWSQVAC